MLSLAAVRWCYSKLMPFGLYFSSLERVAQCKFSMFTAKQPPTYRLHLCGDFQELILHLESHLLALKQRIRVGLWNKEDALVVFCVGECFMSVNKRGRGREREESDVGAGNMVGILYPLCQAVCILYAVWEPLRECVAAELTQWTVISTLLSGLGQQNRPALSHRQVQLLLPKERKEQRQWKSWLKSQSNRSGNRSFYPYCDVLRCETESWKRKKYVGNLVLSVALKVG